MNIWKVSKIQEYNIKYRRAVTQSNTCNVLFSNACPINNLCHNIGTRRGYQRYYANRQTLSEKTLDEPDTFIVLMTIQTFV